MLNSTSPTPFPFPKLVDSTIMSCFDACEAKFAYEYGYHLSPLAINPDLHAGGAFSKGIELTRRGFYEYGLSAEQSLILGVRALTEYWGDFTPPPRNPKTYEAMVGALDDYFREYPLESDPYRPYIMSDGAPAVEFSFSIPTEVRHPETGDPIPYAGRFDMLSVFSNAFLCIMDEKTTKNFSQNWADLWGMRGQFIGYCFAGQYYGHDVSRTCVRGIAIQVTQYKHLPVIEEYPQWQIDRWWETMNKKLARMVECWERNEWVHSYGDSCSSYGGCSSLPLCISEHPEQHFSNFQQRVWNPLEKDPTWPKGGPQYETIGNVKEFTNDTAQY